MPSMREGCRALSCCRLPAVHDLHACYSGTMSSVPHIPLLHTPPDPRVSTTCCHENGEGRPLPAVGKRLGTPPADEP
eukprot:1157574-Pelagomonas_calceolata.AAC.5